MPRPPIDPTSLPGRPCSIASALEIVGDRWSLLAIREVMFGNHRFGEIARNTGAPRDRLSARLKGLVQAGVLERRPSEHDPRYEGYHLTEAGRDLAPVLRTLLAWGDRWAVTSPPMRMLHHDHPLAPATICTTCGELADPADLTRETRIPHWTDAGHEPPAA
ncbi:winged helix-turn-helix transcriptional regulator [Nonomuraea jiangxiensis]|uniref:DNA-binding transcriptional regulator, HxlR family n=1 Tax=Nonomuraea jiangxiensis TaxID=633440 RepID=A0A1G9P2Y5_9ACTN|nr:helix-turn-helix domain-containing protein [Nonomuraea jiangxiensis]SDL93054.1 DNA-binding transcriptional regulator, HxlR family [Nonomuraea jiangxiensis]